VNFISAGRDSVVQWFSWVDYAMSYKATHILKERLYKSSLNISSIDGCYSINSKFSETWGFKIFRGYK